MKKLLENKKRIAIVAAACVVIAIIILLLFLLPKEESYRTIVVEELHGTTLVANEGEETQDAYKGMHLYSGNDVAVQASSDMTMLLDMDKYAYAEEGTRFRLECPSDTEINKTVIHLDDGSVLNRLKSNLNEGDIYNVDTPNSTMAVRGTVFRTKVYMGADSLIYTLLEVFEGQVQVDLKTSDGTYNGISETFHAGESALIRGNLEFSEFVTDENGQIKREISYKELPQNVALVLAEYIDDGETLCISKELLLDYTGLAEHVPETTSDKKATCTEDGHTKVICSVCDIVLEDTSSPALGHTPSEWEVTKEPTCEEEGSRRKVCTVCGVVCEEETLEATSHVPGNYKVTITADCMHGGEQACACTQCGTILSRRETPVLGHQESEWMPLQHATCTTDGSRQKTCVMCGKVMQSETVPANGHSMGNWNILKAASCTTNGSAKRVCSSCSVSETKDLPATGHSFTNWKTVIPVTCVKDGTEVHSCTICKASETRAIPSTGKHQFGDWKPVGVVSCIKDHEEERSCFVCNQKETKTVPAAGHTYGKWNVDKTPSCTEKGYEYRICQSCNYKDEAYPSATGHSYSNKWKIVEATCTDNGSKTRLCDTCGEEGTSEPIPALGHQAPPDEECTTFRLPTCTEQGMKSYECQKCHKQIEEDLPEDPNAHQCSQEGTHEMNGDSSWGESERPIFCTRTCDNCNAPVTVSTNAVLRDNGYYCAECDAMVFFPGVAQ